MKNLFFLFMIAGLSMTLGTAEVYSQFFVTGRQQNEQQSQEEEQPLTEEEEELKERIEKLQKDLQVVKNAQRAVKAQEATEQARTLAPVRTAKTAATPKVY